MKKILTSLVLVGAMATVANAQQYVDLGADPITAENQVMPSTGKGLTATGILDENTAPSDSIQAVILFYIGNKGGPLSAGLQFFYCDPKSELDNDGSLSGWINNEFEENIDTSTYVVYDRRLSVTDSIASLLNITNFENDSSYFSDLIINRADLVSGQTYGWYGYIRNYPFEGAEYSDSFSSNNFTYVPVVWSDATTSIKDLLSTSNYTPLEIYPNPTTDKVSFKLDFNHNNKSTVARVLDISGRVVFSNSFGNSATGIQEFSVDVTKLAPGNYSLQIITDNTISVEKFVKK